MPTRKKRRAEETSLSKAIQQVLTAKGCRVIRLQSGILPVLKGGKTAYVHCAPKGTPDLLVILPMTARVRLSAAEFTFVEVKKKTGKRSKEQTEFAEWAALNGVRCIEARSISEAIAGVFNTYAVSA